MSVKVLVAEDDNDIRFALDLLLSMEGYAVVTAADGEQAYKLAQNENPDLIITDISMPKLSGVELTRLIRHNEKLADKKVLAISAYGEKPKHEVLAAGANCFVSKPIDMDRLLPKIAYLADHQTVQ
ncbi:MAG: response regulator [Acidobacteriota bacterium]